jgi:hypothetical protein
MLAELKEQVDSLTRQLAGLTEQLQAPAVKKAPALALAKLAVDLDATARKLARAQAALVKAAVRNGEGKA